MKKELGKKLKEFWNFVWKEDSLSSWIVSLILIFILVRFIFFPLLSFAMATPMPLVVVESGSMEHPGGFIGNTLGLESNFNKWWEMRGDWYEGRNITKEEAREWPLRSGLNEGDIVVITGWGDLKKGDIIIFDAGKKHPIIHRIVNISKNEEIFYGTKGDNNEKQLTTEKNIPEDRIVGKSIFRVPKLGWIKLSFVNIIDYILGIIDNIT